MLLGQPASAKQSGSVQPKARGTLFVIPFLSLCSHRSEQSRFSLLDRIFSVQFGIQFTQLQLMFALSAGGQIESRIIYNQQQRKVVNDNLFYISLGQRKVLKAHTHTRRHATTMLTCLCRALSRPHLPSQRARADVTVLFLFRSRCKSAQR